MFRRDPHLARAEEVTGDVGGNPALGGPTETVAHQPPHRRDEDQQAGQARQVTRNQQKQGGEQADDAEQHLITGGVTRVGRGAQLTPAAQALAAQQKTAEQAEGDQADHGEAEADPLEFLDIVADRLKLVDLDESMLNRSVNAGFSGGEKKRNEILQLAVLDPVLAILDETDSGLDIDALRTVADGVNKLRRNNNAFLVVTHYQRLLNYIVPDKVHVLVDGRIARSGGKDLALELEERGYDWVTAEQGAGA